MTENSKFFVFEGIDGCGKTTQIGKLSERIRASNKYQDILLTREPTWRDKLIRKALEEDSDPYSSAVAMSHQFIGDRAIHWTEQIKHSLEQEVFVICDRFSLSTCAYQSAQGVPLEELLFAFTVGMLWSSIYEHTRWYRLVKIKTGQKNKNLKKT